MLFNLYSKRKKKERGEYPDVYQYEDIQHTFRVQLVQMLREAFARKNGYFSDKANSTIKDINNVLCREYGVFRLAGEHDKGFDELSKFILQATEHEKVLDVIELTFKYIDKVIRRDSYDYNPHLNTDLFIKELNQRFKEADIGYQFESGEIIRIDSQFIHSEAVIPVLNLLKSKAYSSVNEEFLSAHEHYRHGKYEESTTDCLKALESLLKVICTNRGWAYDSKDTAKKLLNIVLKNDLIPSFMQNQLNIMQTLLESGVPTVRNKLAGHGQGPTSRTMPDYIASYVIHLTATTILMLANADASK